MPKSKSTDQIDPLEETREKLVSVKERLVSFQDNEQQLIADLKEAAQLEATARADVLIDENEISKRAHGKALKACSAVEERLAEHRRNEGALKTAAATLQEELRRLNEELAARNTSRITAELLPREADYRLNLQVALARACAYSAIRSQTPLQGVNPIQLVQAWTSLDEYREEWRKQFEGAYYEIVAELGIEA